MSYLLQSRHRKASLPRDNDDHRHLANSAHQQHPASPPRSSPLASTSSSALPATSPTSRGSSTSTTMLGTRSSPQMIRCSTCMCLVPLVDLSEHVCRPAYPQNQHGPSAVYTQSQSRSDRRPAAPGLRVDVSQTRSHQAGVRTEHGLNTPSLMPLPRSPASLSPSPSPSFSSASPSPAATPSSVSSHSAGTEPYPHRYLDHRNITSNHAYPNSSASSQERRAPTAAWTEGNSREDSMSRSTSAQSNLSALSDGNNAGIGARLPFFEKYQRVYGSSRQDPLNKHPTGLVAPEPAQPMSQPVLAHPVPKSPISPGWSTKGLQTIPADSVRPRQDSGASGLRDEHATRPVENSHWRKASGSETSTRDSLLHRSEFYNYLETPETSPDFPDAPVFPALNGRLNDSVPRVGKATHADLPKVGAQPQNDSTGEYDRAAEDDILDSYPTPQPAFSGRFGALVIDDVTEVEPGPRTAPLPRHTGQESYFEQGIAEPLSARPSDGRTLWPPRLESARDPEQTFVNGKNSTSLRAVHPGLPSSYSSPDNLTRFADKHSAGVQASKSLGSRQRSKTANEDYSPSGNGELYDRTNALDDLLKHMDRDSLIANQNGHSDVTGGRTTTKRVAEDQLCCDSCGRRIPPQGKTVRRGEQAFCSSCYAELYLPKCRKCQSPIEGKAIGAGDGKVKGKFHPACFSCFECSASFPSGDFYVFNERPYCSQHYHALNGTLCANLDCTDTGIEGPCVSLVGEENGGGGRYHPSCFVCSTASCRLLLDEYHYVLDGLPYCEIHARELEDDTTPEFTGGKAHQAQDLHEPELASSHDKQPTPRVALTQPPPRDRDHDQFMLDRPQQQHAAISSEQRGATPPLSSVASVGRTGNTPPPTHLVNSISALRKNAHSPTYMRGQQALGNRPGGRYNQTFARPFDNYAGNGNHQGAPNSQSNHSFGTRRAEKRRTVIQRI